MNKGREKLRNLLPFKTPDEGRSEQRIERVYSEVATRIVISVLEPSGQDRNYHGVPVGWNCRE